MYDVLKSVVVALAFVVSGVGASQSATLSCSTNKATFSLSNALQASCISGNNDAGAGGFFALNPTLFGLDGWTLADKNDGGGDGAIEFSDAPTNDDTSGDWSVASFNGFTNVLITLKAGNGFGAFLLDTAFLSGNWASSKDLSHASIWYSGDPVAPIPLPAAGLLLVGALGAIGLLRRRQNI